MVMKTTYVKLGYQSEWSNSFVACIGYFDGVHLGHQALIKETVRLAKEQQCKSAMISFSPDPWVTIKGLSHVRHLTSMSDRKRLAAEYGIEEWIILSFDKSMASLSAEAFVQEILNKMPLKVLVCGFDFHYGAKGLGTTTTLLEDKKRLFEVSVVKEVTDQNQKISTTRDRKSVV